jgi:hypothetical protein
VDCRFDDVYDIVINFNLFAFSFENLTQFSKTEMDVVVRWNCLQIEGTLYPQGAICFRPARPWTPQDD